MKPKLIGTFEFEPTASLDKLWRVVDPREEDCAYAYLVTTAQPVSYGTSRSRIIYIGKGKRTHNPNYYQCRAFESFGQTLVSLMDGTPSHKGGHDEVRKQFADGKLRLQLHLLPCKDAGADDPRLWEGALLQTFWEMYKEVPKFNIRKGATPPPELVALAKQVLTEFAG